MTPGVMQLQGAGAAGSGQQSQMAYAQPTGMAAFGAGGGGAQNVPNLFGGQQSGFGGYNAGMSNIGGAGALPQNGGYGSGMPGMSQLMQGYQQGGAYDAPVGNPMNPYSNFNMQAMSPGQGLGQQSSQMGYLQDIAGGQGAGAPVNQTPAWQAMVQAQQQNIQTGADQLAEQFNNGGGLFSSAYGSAQGLYQDQARLGQNAQLTAAQTQAMQAANQNQYGAAQQLSSQGYGAVGQLYQGGLQSGIAQMQNQTSMAGLGLQGQLGQMNNQTALQSLGLQGALGAGQLGLQNAQLGNTLGNSQLLANQNQLTSQYQNWYNSQPQNNPLLSMMYAGATGYPQLQQSTYNPGSLGSLLGGVGGLAGGLGALGGSGGLAGLLALSDQRLKTDLKLLGYRHGLPFYEFSYIDGLKTRYRGFMAQDVYMLYPSAVTVGGDDPLTNPWKVNYTKLIELTRKAA